jgi:hypothetical protein
LEKRKEKGEIRGGSFSSPDLQKKFWKQVSVSSGLSVLCHFINLIFSQSLFYVNTSESIHFKRKEKGENIGGSFSSPDLQKKFWKQASMLSLSVLCHFINLTLNQSLFYVNISENIHFKRKEKGDIIYGSFSSPDLQKKFGKQVSMLSGLSVLCHFINLTFSQHLFYINISESIHFERKEKGDIGGSFSSLDLQKKVWKQAFMSGLSLLCHFINLPFIQPVFYVNISINYSF